MQVLSSELFCTYADCIFCLSLSAVISDPSFHPSSVVKECIIEMLRKPPLNTVILAPVPPCLFDDAFELLCVEEKPSRDEMATGFTANHGKIPNG